MSELQLFIKSGGEGRPRDPQIRRAVLEAMQRLRTNAGPAAVSREVIVSLHRTVHWTTARRHLDELAAVHVLVKRSFKQGKKTFLFYDLVTA
ncbi:MAG: hypothetical protein AB1806_15325 [Acidobacteriota bacterium]